MIIVKCKILYNLDAGWFVFMTVDLLMTIILVSYYSFLVFSCHIQYQWDVSHSKNNILVKLRLRCFFPHKNMYNNYIVTINFAISHDNHNVIWLKLLRKWMCSHFCHNILENFYTFVFIFWFYVKYMSSVKMSHQIKISLWTVGLSYLSGHGFYKKCL